MVKRDNKLLGGSGMEYRSMPKKSELESKPIVDTQDSITGHDDKEEENGGNTKVS